MSVPVAVHIRRATAADLAAFNLSSAARHGKTWVAHISGAPQPAGYVSSVRLPGLPDERELELFVRREDRQRGIGSRLLRHALGALRSEASRFSMSLQDNVHSDAAAFLRGHGFSPRFAEVEMGFTAWEMLPAADVALVRYPLRRALKQVRALYTVAFRPTGWYQPFDTLDDVRREYLDGDELLFLEQEGEPIGFVWVRYPAPATAEFEPLGILPAYQNRGLGRRMLVAALHHVRGRGISEVRLGVRTENKAAVHLYRALGFVAAATRTYYVLDRSDGGE